MVSSYEYYFADGNDHAEDPYAFDENDRSHPQHVATPHGAMTEILAATGSTSPPSSRESKQQQQSTTQTRPSSSLETEAKKALRLKAAKHFHRAGSSSAAGGAAGSSCGNDKKSNSSPTTHHVTDVQSPSRVAAIRSSNKYFYPEACSPAIPAVGGQEIKTSVDANIKPASPNVISPSSNDSSTHYNHQLDIIAEDDPEIEVYEEDSASDIGSGYNSGSDLENAARKILRRRGVGPRTSSSKSNYNSDDNASDTGSAVSSTHLSSLRKLPDGWKDRIKRKPGMPKLPPTMEKKEKQPPSSSDVEQQPQQQQQQQQEKTPIEEKIYDDGQIDEDSAGGNQYYNHFSAIAGAYDDSDDDDYYQDHFNGNSNGGFPSFSIHNNYDVNSGGQYDDNSSCILDHPPIFEEHIFGPIQPSTIYESNDEYEQDENDGPLFEQEWNPDGLKPLNDDDRDENVGTNDGAIKDVDECGFPSPSRHKKVDNTGFPSPSRKTKNGQRDQQQLEQSTVDESIDSIGNEFNENDYFHQFKQDWGHEFLPPPGVKWKTSTKRGTTASPPVTDDDILATFSSDKEDTTVPSFAWSDSSFRDNVGASASPQCSALTEEETEGNEKERQHMKSPLRQQEKAKEKISPAMQLCSGSDSSFRDNVGASASPQCSVLTEEETEGNEKERQHMKSPLRQQEKAKEKISPAMQPFSDGDLSDPDNDICDVEASVATTTQSKRGLNFFKRKGRRYHSEGERSDSECDTDTNKNSPRLKALSPLRRKHMFKKQTLKKNEPRRKLFGTPKNAEKSGPPVHAHDPAPTSETHSNPDPRVTPLVSNKKKTDDSKPFSSVDLNENDGTDDKTVSTLGSIITKEASTTKARVASSNASTNTAMSEIERLRKENDKLRHELERQAVRRENERLRQELEKRAATESSSPHRQRRADSVGESSDESFRVKGNPRNGMHKSTLTSLLESDVKSNHRNRRHRVTKNHLMNQADFDDESITTYSPIRPRRYERTNDPTGPELLTKVAGATGWVAEQVRNAAQGQGHRSLDCFTACTRNDTGRRRRRGNGSRGIYDDNESDTDSLDDDSLMRNGGWPRSPIARRKAAANRSRRGNYR